MRLITLGVVMWLALGAAPAEACTCLPPSRACGAADPYWRSAAVFLGRVEAVDATSPKVRGRFLATRRVRLKVLEPFRGAPVAGSEVVVATGSGGGDCGYPFKEGEDYLVYATRQDEGSAGAPASDDLTTSICHATRPIATAGADLDYARAVVAGRAPAGRVMGEVRLQTRDLASSRRPSTQPMAGITVLLTQDRSVVRAVTDAQGRYTVEGLAPGKYTLGVDLPDTYYTVQDSRTIDVPDGRACADATVFVLHNGRVSGRVVDAAGRAVAGLTIDLTVPARLDEQYGPERLRTLTARDGTFELARVPPGRFVVGINTRRDSGGEPLEPRVFYPGVENVGDARAVVVPAGGRVALDDFVLPADVRYVRQEGVVLAQDGSPAAGARVFLRKNSDAGSILGEPAVADASGAFVVGVVAGHTYRVFAERARGTNGQSVEVSDPVTLTAADAPAPLRIHLRRRY